MQVVPTLLKRLEVSAIYWIDDENASEDELDIDKLVGFVAQSLPEATPDQRTSALNVIRKHRSGDALLRQIARSIETELSGNADHISVIDKVEQLLREKLPNALGEDDPKTVLCAMLRELPQPLTLHEKEALSATFDPRGSDKWIWRPLSFTKWGDDHGSILRQHLEDTERALLVVDLQNTREASSTSGSDILEQWAVAIRSNQKKNSVIAVALTGQIKPEDELRESRKLTDKLFNGDAPELPVFVLSKTRLQSKGNTDVTERAKEAISHVLRRMRACQLHVGLAETFQSLFASSVEHAFSKLQQLSIEELLLAVSSSSFAEGAHEIDTLVRMASIAQRQAILSGLAKNSDVQASLIELRGLGTEGVKRTHLEAVTGLDDLRSSELHDPGEIVNALLSPTSPGDVFEFSRVNEDKDYYVLVASACDMVLRGKKGERKLANAILLPLLLSPGDLDTNFLHPVTHFPEGSPLEGKQAWVNLRQYLTASLDVLDLCWANKDGQCFWSKTSTATDDLHLLPAQRLRYDAISLSFEQSKTVDLIQSSPNGLPFIRKSDDGKLASVNFRIKRIGRFSGALTLELVQKTAQIFSRPSMEHDYSGAS